MIKKLLIVIIIFLILLAGGVYAFMRVKGVGQATLTPVKLRLKWFDQAQFAGNYVAMEKGFYKDNGLDVSIVPFSYDVTNIDEVVSGKADFGIAGADEILVARTAGKPVKAVAVIYKINPGVFFTKKTSGISKPQDFVGKRIGIQKGMNIEFLYRAMMNILKVDRSKVTEIPVGFDYSELINGKVDASVGYIINRPETSTGAAIDMNTILMADYGVNMYADVLFTTDDMVANNPKVVDEFVQATINGWQYAIEHEPEAVDITLKFAKNSTKAHEDYMLSTSIPLINTGTSNLGWMDLASWESAQDLLFDQKILTKKIDAADVFDMDFINRIYGTK